MVDFLRRLSSMLTGGRNAEVLQEVLGCTDDELAALEDAKVIGDWPVGIDRPAKENTR